MTGDDLPDRTVDGARTQNRGVALSHYRTHGPDMAVEFRCLDCQLWFDVPLSVVISRLVARGVGGPETGIKEVARLVEKPCARCGSKRYETRPSFPQAPYAPRKYEG